MSGKRFTRVAIGVGAMFIVIQLVPYGRSHANPPVRSEPAWSAPDIRVFAARACFDCHSNETRWPWYSHVAPMSWLVQRDVEEGRRVLNFSEWNRPQPGAAESAEETAEGDMPPATYSWLHSEARLSAVEREGLILGLKATLGSGKGQPGHGGDD